MKLYLDDERTPPPGWDLVKTADEAIIKLMGGDITEVSLDHDLGPMENGTGYDVIVWIEEQVALYDYVPPKIHIHTGNPSAAVKMNNCLKKINEMLSLRK
jgi:hypothetical protein